MSDNNNNSESAAKKRKADKLEPSPRGKKLTNDLLSSLDDPDLCDVTLVGSDGGRVPAVRAYLSARSDVLKRLLVGRFKEASEEEVRMDYPSAVIKAMVHFCCTDEVPKLPELAGDDDSAESLRLSAKLLNAADYYGLDSMKEKTLQRIQEFNEANESLVGLHICVLFQETSTSPSLKEYHRSILYAIERNPGLLLVHGEFQPAGVTYLSSETLFKIVDDQELCACAWILFKAIGIWDDEGTYGEELSPEDRREFAKKCCAKLELRMMSASDLLRATESGLVDQSAITKALKKQMNGSAIGLYGAEFQCLNGIFEEVPINDNYEPLVGGDVEPMLVAKKRKRFDKTGQVGDTDVAFSILHYHYNTPSESIFLAIVAPPKGASRLVTAEDLKKILQDNRVLYKAMVRKRQFERNGVANIKWKSGGETAWDSVPPTTILGPALSSTMPISF